MNQGQCINTDLTGYVCKCPQNYTGIQCQTSSTPCPPNYFNGEITQKPCSVFCADTDTCDGHYMCSNVGTKVCLTGWTGTDCITPNANATQDCPTGNCTNGGTCFNQTCCCAPGYEGPLCGKETDECESNPCQNGATCKDEVNRYTCVCAPGMYSITIFLLHT